ncbi:unnamed protein product [Cochlearia groenlandica]
MGQVKDGWDKPKNPVEKANLSYVDTVKMNHKPQQGGMGYGRTYWLGAVDRIQRLGQNLFSNVVDNVSNTPVEVTDSITTIGLPCITETDHEEGEIDGVKEPEFNTNDLLNLESGDETYFDNDVLTKKMVVKKELGQRNIKDEKKKRKVAIPKPPAKT